MQIAETSEFLAVYKVTTCLSSVHTVSVLSDGSLVLSTCPTLRHFKLEERD